MSDSLQNARDFRELLQAPDDGGPYLYAEMFSDESRGARRRSKKKLQLLRRLDPQLRPMLRPGERVFFLTQGVSSPSFLEWYFLGWVMYYLNRRAIVLTSHRILLLQINSRGKPLELREQIDYAGLAGVKATMLGNTKVRFRDGKAVLLTGIQRADRKYFSSLMDRARSLEGESGAPGVQKLCPHCFVVVDGWPNRCDACAGRFKSVRTATWLSMILPGAGDLYLGHTGFAVLELFGSVVFWFVVLALALDPSIGGPELIVTIGFVIVVIHGVDALATRHVAKKGLLPLPSSGRGDGWRFVAAAAFPVAILIAVGARFPTKVALLPPSGVVRGEEIPTAQVDAIRRAGYIEEGEEIVYFFSDGVTNILEDGNLLTDHRVVSYAQTDQDPFHEMAPYGEIIDLRIVPPEPPSTFIFVYVVREDGRVFPFIVPAADGTDQPFLVALHERWRAARDAQPDGGVWYDGGGGRSAGDAVVIRGAQSMEVAEAAELVWLQLWFGTENEDWSVNSRARHAEGERLIDELTVPFADRETAEFFFDLTQVGSR